MTYAEFQQNAESTSIFEDAVADLRRERESDVVDRDYARLNENWNLLAHQVVGQERF